MNGTESRVTRQRGHGNAGGDAGGGSRFTFGVFDGMGVAWKPVGEQKSCKGNRTKCQTEARVTQGAAPASRTQGRKITPGMTQEIAGTLLIRRVCRIGRYQQNGAWMVAH